jgi:POT family proton-dependent oligopeptide transporter
MHMPGKDSVTVFGHPKGAFLLAGTEMWERFGFFGMMGLLVHFLTASPLTSGFGWDAGNAKALVGNLFAAMWVFPIIGSWFADRYIGARRSLVIGAAMMVLGYFLFALPAAIPHLVELGLALPVVVPLQQSGVALGQIWLDEGISTALLQQSVSPQHSIALNLAYRLMGISFYLGLLMIVAGNAFFKPCIVALVGRFYEKGDSRREGGYTILYLCINLGGLISNFLVGSLGERLGWHYGFAAAGTGMLIGLFVLLINKRSIAQGLHPRATGPARISGRAGASFSHAERQHFKAIAVLMFFTAVYVATYGQLIGLVNEFVFNRTERMLWGFEVPATWFLSLNPLFIILFGAFLAGLWQRLEKERKNPSALLKYFVGMVLISFSFLVLAGAAEQGSSAVDGKSHMSWIIVAYLFFTLGELFIFPIFMALITRLGPAHYGNLAAGLFFFAAGIGGYLSGQIGTLSERFGDRLVFSSIATGALLAGLAALTLISRFRVWIPAGNSG